MPPSSETLPKSKKPKTPKTTKATKTPRAPNPKRIYFSNLTWYMFKVALSLLLSLLSCKDIREFSDQDIEKGQDLLEKFQSTSGLGKKEILKHQLQEICEVLFVPKYLEFTRNLSQEERLNAITFCKNFSKGRRNSNRALREKHQQESTLMDYIAEITRELLESKIKNNNTALVFAFNAGLEIGKNQKKKKQDMQNIEILRKILFRVESLIKSFGFPPWKVNKSYEEFFLSHNEGYISKFPQWESSEIESVDLLPEYNFFSDLGTKNNNLKRFSTDDSLLSLEEEFDRDVANRWKKKMKLG